MSFRCCPPVFEAVQCSLKLSNTVNHCSLRFHHCVLPSVIAVSSSDHRILIASPRYNQPRWCWRLVVFHALHICNLRIGACCPMCSSEQHLVTSIIVARPPFLCSDPQYLTLILVKSKSYPRGSYLGFSFSLTIIASLHCFFVPDQWWWLEVLFDSLKVPQLLSRI